MTSRRLPALIAVLLVLAAALLALGVTLERNGTEPAAGPRVEVPAGEHSEGGEGAEGHAAAEGSAAEGSVAETDRTVLGVPVESPWTITVVALVSVGLAYAVWRRPVRPVLAVVGLVSLGAAVFDVLEVTHQLDESRTGLALLAGLVAATRLTVLVAAGVLWRAAPNG